jgi:hypothetical protein
MVPLSKNQLKSKFTSLANANIAWGNYYSPTSYTHLRLQLVWKTRALSLPGGWMGSIGKFISLVNGNFAWGKTIVPLATIDSFWTNVRHWGYFLLVDCYNMLSVCIVDKWNSINFVLLEKVGLHPSTLACLTTISSSLPAYVALGPMHGIRGPFC